MALKKFLNPAVITESSILRKLMSNNQIFDGGVTLVDRNRNLELAFVDKEGKVYSLAEVDSAELAKGLEKISKETAKRLLLQKNKDRMHCARNLEKAQVKS